MQIQKINLHQQRVRIKMDNIATILVALFSGGALKYFFDYLIEKRKLSYNEANDNFSQLFKSIHKIYLILNNLQFHTGSHRVVIIKVQDSGGVPSLLTPLRSSILYEVFTDPLPSAKGLWTGVKVGEPYIKLLQDLYENGKIHYEVEPLPIDSELRDIHIEKKTKYVESFFLLKEEKFFLYVSIHFDKVPYCLDDRGATYRNSVRSNIKKLQELLGQDHKSNGVKEEKEVIDLLHE